MTVGQTRIVINGGGMKNGKDYLEKNVSYDRAMELTGFGKFHVGILLLSQLTFLGMILETLGFSYVLPAAQCDLNLTQAERGYVASIPFITIILSSNFWGWFADSYGRKKAILLSTSGGCILSLISSFAPEMISFAIIRVICGLFVSGCSSLVYSFIGEMSSNRARDKMLILANSALTIGTAIVPLFAWGILPLNFRYTIDIFGYDYRPWRLLICSYAIPHVICSLIIIHVPETPKFLYAKGNLTEALEVMKKIHRINNGKSEVYPVVSLVDDSTEGTMSEKKQNFWNICLELFKLKHLSKTLLFSIMQFVALGSNNGFYIWLPEVINKVVNNPSSEPKNICLLLNSVSSVQEVTSAMNGTIPVEEICDDSLRTEAFTYTIGIGIAATVLAIVSAFSLSIIGKRIQLVAFFFMAGTVSLVMNFAYNPVASLILFMAYQFIGPTVGLGNAFVVEYYPTSIRATAVSVILMIGRLGSITATNLIGYLIRTSCPTTFYLFAVLLYAVGFSSFLYPKENKKEKDIVKVESDENYNTKL